jgi:hypothetical protein
VSRAHFTQAVAANVILGVATAVLAFGAQPVPALLGGVCAGISLIVWFRARERRTHKVPERK